MAIEDTGWKQGEVITTDKGPTGQIVPATGIEQAPCFTCASWEKDNRKLIQHFNAKGLQPDAEGFYETPIARDIQGRKSMRIHPRDFGFCRRQCVVSHMNATCPDWAPTRTRGDLAGKIR
jgi:hypothetical protein